MSVYLPQNDASRVDLGQSDELNPYVLSFIEEHVEQKQKIWPVRVL